MTCQGRFANRKGGRGRSCLDIWLGETIGLWGVWVFLAASSEEVKGWMRETFVPSGNHWLVLTLLWAPATSSGPRNYTVCVFMHVQSCPTLCDPMDCSPPGSSEESMAFSRQEYWSGLPFPIPGGQNHVSFVSCIGRQSLYHCATW